MYGWGWRCSSFKQIDRRLAVGFSQLHLKGLNDFWLGTRDGGTEASAQDVGGLVVASTLWIVFAKRRREFVQPATES